MNLTEPMPDPTAPGYPTYRCKRCGTETSVLPEENQHSGCGGAWVRDIHVLDGLNEHAVATLEAAGIAPEDWVTAHTEGIVFAAGEAPYWLGDRCGCTDSRCIGHHHLREDNCGCLPVLIDLYLTGTGSD